MLDIETAASIAIKIESVVSTRLLNRLSRSTKRSSNFCERLLIHTFIKKSIQSLKPRSLCFNKGMKSSVA